MKILRYIFLWLLVGLAPSLGNSQELIASYSFDNTVEDQSGYNNHGAIFGSITPTEDRFGNPCSALLFDGNTGYIEVPNSPSLQRPNSVLSVTSWFKIEHSNFSDYNWLTLICKGSMSVETDNMPQFRVQLMQGQSQSTVSINSEITEYDYGFRQHQFKVGQWQFFALVYDGSFIKAYLDAELIFQFPYRNGFALNNSPLHIAKDIPGSTEYFKGALDDLKIYNSVLSHSEIRGAYLAPNTIPPIVEQNLECPANITLFSDGACSAIVHFPTPTMVTDLCSGQINVAQVSGLTSGSDFAVGNTVVAFVSTGVNGNHQSCSFNIIVFDDEPPTLTDSRDTVLYAIVNEDGAYFAYPEPLAFDNCGNVVLQRLSGISSGGKFPIGETVITYMATDGSNNSISKSFSVFVKSQEIEEPLAPVIDTLIVQVFDTIRIIDSVIISTPTSLTDSVPSSQVASSEEIDKVKFIYNMNFDDCLVTIELYDDKKEDHDTISVFFNDHELVDRQMIRNLKNGAIVKLLVLNPYESNELIVKAWNMGEVGKNTLRINFYHGDYTLSKKKLKRADPFQSKILHSKPGLSGGIKMACKTPNE